MKWSTALAALVGVALWAAPADASAAVHIGPRHKTGHHHKSGHHHQTAHDLTAQDLGPNVTVFTPTEPQAQIQSALDTISAQQVSNQFGTQRYSVFFEPGTYGSAADPLDFQIGFYTQVAGLGEVPGDTVINGSINVFNQCVNGACDGTDNFWRSLSNLTLNVTQPTTTPNYAPFSGDPYGAGCDNSTDMWAVSQADPMRSVIVNGRLTLQDYCSPTGDVSGGYLANDELNGELDNYGQQQFFSRNTNMQSWDNAVWNQVFVGDNGAPATNFGISGGQYTTVAQTPVSEEEPFLYTNSGGTLSVFVPGVLHDSVGPSYASGSEVGSSLPISKFFVASASTPESEIQSALDAGGNLLLEPGVYNLPRTLQVNDPDTVIIGLGFATLIPQNGNVAMSVADVPGVKLSGVIFDAGPKNSPSLLEVGTHSSWGWGSDPNKPTLLQDVFFRVGGAEAGKTTDALIVNSNDTILDDVWIWRADHGNGVGWTENTANTGLIVNGDNVTAYGLAVEHFQKDEVIWNGQHGSDYFFQNEMPYDPPSQAAWMSNSTTAGYPAFLVTHKVKTFQGYGMGSYSFFNQGVPIWSAEAFKAPAIPGVQFHGLLTVFLSPAGFGGISSVIDGVGGSSTIANKDTAVDVPSFP